MEKIKYDNKWCAYKKIEKLTHHWDDPIRFCPFCKQQISSGNSIYLFVNNHILFPNIMCHSKCICDEVTKDTIEKLINSYKYYCDIHKNIRAWEGSCYNRRPKQ